MQDHEKQVVIDIVGKKMHVVHPRFVLIMRNYAHQLNCGIILKPLSAHSCACVLMDGSNVTEPKPTQTATVS